MDRQMRNEGILIVVSGFSGAGKGTLMKRLVEEYDGYALSISATTRKPARGRRKAGNIFSCPGNSLRSGSKIMH